MKRKKANKLITKTVFVVGGLSYFMFFSGLDLPIFLKYYVTIIPIQIAAALYLGYQYYKNKNSQKTSNQLK